MSFHENQSSLWHLVCFAWTLSWETKKWNLDWEASHFKAEDFVKQGHSWDRTMIWNYFFSPLLIFPPLGTWQLSVLPVVQKRDFRVRSRTLSSLAVASKTWLAIQLPQSKTGQRHHGTAAPFRHRNNLSQSGGSEAVAGSRMPNWACVVHWCSTGTVPAPPAIIR